MGPVSLSLIIITIIVLDNNNGNIDNPYNCSPLVLIIFPTGPDFVSVCQCASK